MENDGKRLENKVCANDLWRRLQEEWARILDSALKRLAQSMPRSCAAAIEAKGYATKY